MQENVVSRIYMACTTVVPVRISGGTRCVVAGRFVVLTQFLQHNGGEEH